MSATQAAITQQVKQGMLTASGARNRRKSYRMRVLNAQNNQLRVQHRIAFAIESRFY